MRVIGAIAEEATGDPAYYKKHGMILDHLPICLPYGANAPLLLAHLQGFAPKVGQFCFVCVFSIC